MDTVSCNVSCWSNDSTSETLTCERHTEVVYTPDMKCQEILPHVFVVTDSESQQFLKVCLCMAKAGEGMWALEETSHINLEMEVVLCVLHHFILFLSSQAKNHAKINYINTHQ